MKITHGFMAACELVAMSSFCSLVCLDGENASEKNEVCLNWLVKDLLISLVGNDIVFDCDCCVSF